MKRSTRRLLWILGAILVVLIGIGGYVFYISTNAALSQAEGFQFRRMRVAQVGDENVFRFFFVSNRVAAEGPEPLKDRLGAERGPMLHFGSFDTEIEPTLGLGRWLDASSWFLDEEINILNVQSMDRTAYVNQLRGMISRSPHRGLLILVHGLRTNFDFALRGTAFLAHVLDINAPVMVFDWPANQGSSLRSYRRAQQLASASGAELADLLRLIVRDVRPDKLWLVANSLAGQVVVDAVGLLAQDSELADAEPEIDHVVLTAPDVSRTGFKGRFKQDLAAVARNTTIYVSSNDRALLLSRVVNLAPRLGQSTLSKADADLVDEVQDMLALLEPDSTRIALVDVTPVNRTRNFHNFSLEVPEYFDDMYLRLVNAGTPLNRLRYQFVTPAGSTYSVLTRAR